MHDLTCIVHNFNRANFLKKCLNSIFNQDTKYRFQIIVIDDCSTDGSEGVALKISKKFPMVPFNFFKTEKNTGIGKKAAISLKSEIDEIFHCKYFMRIDSDDFINDSDKFLSKTEPVKNLTFLTFFFALFINSCKISKPLIFAFGN